MTLHAVKVDLPELKRGDITNYEWYGDIKPQCFAQWRIFCRYPAQNDEFRLGIEFSPLTARNGVIHPTKTWPGYGSNKNDLGMIKWGLDVWLMRHVFATKSISEPENSPGRTWNDPSKWAKKHWEVWKTPRAQRHELDMTHANPCETSQVWISSNTYQ